jgi:hypothetical protein
MWEVAGEKLAHLVDVDAEVREVVDGVHLVQGESSVLVQALLVTLRHTVTVHNVHGDDAKLVGRAIR